MAVLAMDEAVVARQVVLRQEVDLEGGLRHAGQPRLVGRPGPPFGRPARGGG